MTRAPWFAMHGPYRIPPEPREPDEAADAGNEDFVLALLLLGLGGLRVAIAVATGEAWGAEPSIAMLMLMCGVGLLLHRS